ncbi:MAG: PhnD/SsuA/transferrin family substrate-binding protein [Acidaminococcaceae bacterium]|nr:PhnD/SsuA/transferrin family substrate-binding protein [Acidaminococcaceae bacterium]
MKKLIAFVVFFCIFAGLLAGCGGGEKKSAGSGEIKELKIAVSPYQDAETVKTAVGPLSAMLQGKLKEKGFSVGKVSISVGTSYSAVGEALSAGSADAGFVSGAT